MAGLTDEQMAALEAKHAAGGLTDDELEAKAAPGLPAAPQKSLAERALGVLQGATELTPSARLASYVTHPDRARAALMGVTSSAAPRVLAGMEGIKGALTPGESFSGNYDKALPDYQRQYMKAADENPVDNIGGAMLQPNPLAKVKAATTVGKVALAGGRVAQSSTLGGLNEYFRGGSRGDVTDSALKSGGIQAGLEALSPIAGKAASYFGGKAQAMDAKAADMVSKDAMALYKKATGGLGGEVAAGRNAHQVMQEIISSPSSTSQQKAAAQSLVDDPEMMKMLHRVYDNAIQAMPQRMGNIQNAEKGVQDAAAKNTPEALAAAKDDLMSDPISKRVIPSVLNRVKRHVVPAIGAAAGVGLSHALGVDPYYGIAAGGLLGHTSKQLLSHPSVAAPLLSGAESLASGAASAATAPGGKGLEQWLTKKPDDEREKEGAEYFSSATGGR